MDRGKVIAVALLSVALACGSSGAGEADGGRDLGGEVDVSWGDGPGPAEPGEVVGKDSEGDQKEEVAAPDLGADPGAEPAEAADAPPEVQVAEDPGPDAADDPGSPPDVPADTSGPCLADPPVAADGPRTVLVTHPFSEESGVCGRGLEVLRLETDGALVTTGTVLDVGSCPWRVVFSPDGRLVLVVNNNNDPQAGDRGVVVLRHHADGSLEIVNELKEFAFRAVDDVAFSLDGTRAYVTDNNVVGEGGVHVLAVNPGCNASYVSWIDLHHASSIAMLPGGLHAAVMAGPVWNDTKDLAFLDLESGTVAGQTSNFSDFVSAFSLGVPPDGRTLVVPNASAFSELADTLTVMSLTLTNGVPVPAIQQVVTDVYQPTELIFSPDGTKMLATTFDGDSVRWFHVAEDGDLSDGGNVTGIGLADRADMLRRGPLAGYVVVSSVTDVARLRFTATGLEKMPKLALGEGSDKICGDIAIEP